MNNGSLIQDYTQGPVARQLLRFAWPFMVSNLLQTAYNLADMIVVGHFTGPAGLSAVSIGGEIIHLYTFLAMGLCSAGQIMISQYIGLKDRPSVSKTIGTMFGFVLAMSLAVTALGLCFNRVFLGWLNVPEEAWESCLAYTSCCTAGCFFIYGYNMVSSTLRGMGDSKHPMLFITAAAVLNVGLDLPFVSGGMGAFGAALATVIAQGVSFLGALVFLYRRREDLGFDFRPRSFLPERRTLGLLIRLGVPMMLQSCAISISSLFVTSFINAYGVVVSAVTGVGSKLSTVASIITLALSHAGATMVGQNFAAGRFDRVRRILWISWGVGGVFAALLSGAVLLWPEPVFALFNDDPAVLAMSRSYAPVAVINFFGWALRGPSAALCNGMGFASMNLVLGVTDGVVMRIGLCLLMGVTLGMGINGFWYGSALAGWTFFLVMFPYLLSGRGEKRRPPVAAG